MSTNSYDPPHNASNREGANPQQQPPRGITPIAVLRSIGGVFGGMLAAVFVVFALEGLGHKLYPPPPGIDVHNPEALKTIIDQFPVGAIVMVLVAWGVGTLAGAFSAAAIAGRARVVHGLVVGGIIMAFAALTMIMIPHPLWFMIASVFVVVTPALLGGFAAELLFDRSGPRGPKPYDMRKKNMAC